MKLHSESVATEPGFCGALSRRIEAARSRQGSELDSLRLTASTPSRKRVAMYNNDYLGIANDPRIRAAELEALRTDRPEVMMSSVFQPEDDPQRMLERRMGAYAHSADATLFQSGYMANIGLLQAIAGPDTLVYPDAMAHASIYEGVACAQAVCKPFRHNDLGHLERRVRESGPGIVFIDSVYSTNGSVAPLREIAQLCKRQGSVLVVDESHSLGTHGPEGAGLVVAEGLEDLVRFRTASLAKAFSARAGIVFGGEGDCQYLRYKSRASIFSSGLVPIDLARIGATLDVIRSLDRARAGLARNARRLRTGLASLGYNLNGSESQIVGLEAGSVANMVQTLDALRSHGILGAPFYPPATAENRALVRLSVSATHGTADIERVIQACDQMRDQVGMVDWRSTKRLNRRRRLELGEAA